MRTLDAPPAELMLVEFGEEGTDPYNSGVFKRPTSEDFVEFLRDDAVMVGDLKTAVKTEELL